MGRGNVGKHGGTVHGLLQVAQNSLTVNMFRVLGDEYGNESDKHANDKAGKNHYKELDDAQHHLQYKRGNTPHKHRMMSSA